MNILNRNFYKRPTYEVAEGLIGKKLVRLIYGRSPQILSGIIVETEAYGCEDDEASHAFNGLTVKNSMMFGGPGRAYVYLSYGIHFCFNITAYSPNHRAGAVLIRAIQPVAGVSTMRRLRATDDPFLIASGPGRLTKALDIGLNHNGVDVTFPNPIIVETGVIPAAVLVSSRVGISTAKNKQWRYVFGHLNRRTGLPSYTRYASKYNQTYSRICRSK